MLPAFGAVDPPDKDTKGHGGCQELLLLLPRWQLLPPAGKLMEEKKLSISKSSH